MNSSLSHRLVSLTIVLAMGLCTVGLLIKRSAAQSDTSVVANLIVSIQGEVSFKRQGWTNYEPLVFGTNLVIGDLLRLAPSAGAKLVCADLTLHELLPGASGVPCAAAQSVLKLREGSWLNPTRNTPVEGSFPLVLSPRKTKLLSTTPKLRWTPVKGADAYDVTVRSSDLMWSYRTAATEIAYPTSAPHLRPGVDYKLIVTYKNESSNDEGGMALGFSLLSESERKIVEKQVAQIAGMKLPNDVMTFLTAYIYAAHELNAEAIEKLESIKGSFRVSAVPRMLGNLYLTVGLPRQAEAAFLESLKLSEKEKDEQGQIEAHSALADIYHEAFGNNKEAKQHLNAMLELARTLGDQKTEQETEKRLAKLD
jgi:hypothetical protein